MHTRLIALAVVFGLCLSPASAWPQKGGEDISGPYDVAAGWPQPFTRSGYIWGSQSGVFAETPNRVFLLGRGELKLPAKLPAAFTGNWGSLGTRANAQEPELRN